MYEFNKALSRLFSENARKTEATWAKAYLRNQFEHFGIPTPIRRRLFRELIATGLPEYDSLPEIVNELWSLPQREYQYAGIELISAYKKVWKPALIRLTEELIINKSWWDTVDSINSQISGPFFLLFPQLMNPVTESWNRNSNIWLQRSSLMFQKSYRGKTNKKILAAYIRNCRHSPEFFVQKAIGWSLRELSKHDAEWVVRFVRNNELPALSRREALKHIRS